MIDLESTIECLALVKRRLSRLTDFAEEVEVIDDAITLLKAQEPVKPKWQKGYAYCGQCGYKLHWIVERHNFCPDCGKEVKWND